MTYREVEIVYEGVGMTEGLKLTIFTYKWGKCGKNMEKCPLESLIKQGFPPTSKISHSRLS